MEIVIIGGLALVALWWFFFREKQVESKPAAPYKVETPPAVAPVAEPAKCGCGRSPTGYCVGLHKLSDAEWAVHTDNPNKVEQPVAPAEAKATPAKKPSKPRAKKPATAKAAPAKAKPAKKVGKK